MPVTFFTDAHAFLDAAAPALERDPLRATVIASNAQRFTERPLPEWAWFAIVDVDGAQHLVMRTHPDEPHAGFTPPLPPAALDELIAALAERREVVPAWNGDLDTSMALCRAANPDAEPTITIHTRLFELEQVTWPPQPVGSLRGATLADVDLCLDWMERFWFDSETQGGRTPEDLHLTPDQLERRRDATAQRIEHKLLWLWEVDGVPVQMTGLTLPNHGVVRIGPVFTPAEHRVKGYAGWVVATLSQRILDAGHRPCLYTDQANPVSNKVYERIGYVRAADEGNVSSV